MRFLLMLALLAASLPGQFRYVPSRGDLTVVGSHAIGGRFTLHAVPNGPWVDMLLLGQPTHVVVCPFGVLRVVPVGVVPFASSHTLDIPRDVTLVGTVHAFQLCRRDPHKAGCDGLELTNAVELWVTL